MGEPIDLLNINQLTSWHFQNTVMFILIIKKKAGSYQNTFALYKIVLLAILGTRISTLGIVKHSYTLYDYLNTISAALIIAAGYPILIIHPV